MENFMDETAHGGSLTKKLEICRVDASVMLGLPYAEEGVRAGFPSPAQDFMDRSIDLNRDLVSHPESTFYARVAGDSMIDAGLRQGDILVVDKSLAPQNGDIAVCIVNGDFTVKTLKMFPDHVVLEPANKDYSPLRITGGDQFEVWGVVTYVIKAVKRGR